MFVFCNVDYLPVQLDSPSRLDHLPKNLQQFRR
jgi:hypothetical protein